MVRRLLLKPEKRKLIDKSISKLNITRNPGDAVADLHFKNRTRFVMLILTTLCLSISQSNVLTLNFTVICMTGAPIDINLYNQTGQIFEMENGTYYETGNGTYLLTYEQDVANKPYNYTPAQKNMLFSIVAIGAMVFVYPCMILIEKFGSRWIVSIFGFFSALCTALIPLAADLGYGVLVAMRFFQGSGLATGFTLIGIVTLQWSMKKQSAIFIAVLSAFFQIGPIFTMPVAGALCTSSLGWQSVYYLHCIVTCVLFMLFLYFYREQPQTHVMVSEKELDRIRRLKGDVTKKDPLPIMKMITSPSILCCWVTAVGNFLGIQVTMQFSPTYLNKVMGFSIESTGVLSAIPQVVTFFVKIAAGFMADKMNCCTPKTSVKVFNSIAIGGMGITFFIIAFIPTSAPMVGLIVLIFCCSIVGFNCGAFFRSSALVAAQHNHFVMGVNSFINCACSLLAPVLVNIFVSTDSWSEWWWVWMVHGAILTIGNIVFVIFGQGEAAEWTKKEAPKVVANTLEEGNLKANKVHPKPGTPPVNQFSGQTNDFDEEEAGSSRPREEGQTTNIRL